ncbi:MAG: hypothetical protein U1F56_11590 [Rubrivivax sp.]
MFRLPSFAALLALALPLLAAAQDKPPRGGEPRVERHVAEDDHVRIEELRVRGQTERIVVRLKDGGRPYEILPANGGRDLSQDKRAIGQRVWSVLSF